MVRTIWQQWERFRKVSRFRSGLSGRRPSRRLSFEGLERRELISASLGLASSANGVRNAPGADHTVVDTSRAAGVSSFSAAKRWRPPAAPIALTPANGAAGVSLTPTLAASAYYAPDGEKQTASCFTIYAQSNDQSVWSDTETSGNLTMATVPAGVLRPATTYYWCAQYADKKGGWSGDCNCADFATVGPTVATPANANAATPTTLSLSVLGADSSGEASLTYTWTTTLRRTAHLRHF